MGGILGGQDIHRREFHGVAAHGNDQRCSRGGGQLQRRIAHITEAEGGGLGGHLNGEPAINVAGHPLLGTGW